MKTRNNREVTVEMLETQSLSEARMRELSEELFAFAHPNTKSITLPYIRKRLETYGALALVRHEKKLVGFGFADERHMELGPFRRVPLVHYGLMIIDSAWRGERVSTIMSKKIAWYVIRRNKFRSLFGFAVSAKCSSPVSFYRLQQASFKLGFPKFNHQGELSRTSRLRFSKVLSRSVSRALKLAPVEDFVIKNVNEDSGFQLTPESYETNSKYEENVVRYFKKHVIPKNEVLFVTYGHPLMVL